VIKDKFVISSLFFFLNQILISFSGWIYWFVISRFASPYQIGQATTIYSFVILTTTVIQMGLEYPLLKRSSSEFSRLLGTTLIIELIITSASIPIVLYLLSILLYQQQFHNFSIMAALMIVFLSIGFVLRFALYGVFKAKKILIIDIISTFIKFFIGLVLISTGYGSFAILLSFLSQIVFVCFGYLGLAIKKQFNFRLGEMRYAIGIIFEGLVNMPSKISTLFISNLVIVLLAYYGVGSSEIGVFYIAQIISIVGGGLMSSISFMVIPASFESRKDLSQDSLRVGISLTALIISFLISSPKFILSLIGTQYIAAQSILFVLSIGIFPYSIAINAISTFNYIGNPKKILTIGCIQLAIFIAMFLILVPHYRTMGAALAILISFAISSIPAMFWLSKSSVKYVFNSGISILFGCTIGHVVAIAINNVINGFISSISAILISLSLTFMMIMLTRNLSIVELKQLLKSATKIS
jgi:O-antigen/teichoic acid export membrane protein